MKFSYRRAVQAIGLSKSDLAATGIGVKIIRPAILIIHQNLLRKENFRRFAAKIRTKTEKNLNLSLELPTEDGDTLQSVKGRGC